MTRVIYIRILMILWIGWAKTGSDWAHSPYIVLVFTINWWGNYTNRSLSILTETNNMVKWIRLTSGCFFLDRKILDLCAHLSAAQFPWLLVKNLKHKILMCCLLATLSISQIWVQGQVFQQQNNVRAFPLMFSTRSLSYEFPCEISIIVFQVKKAFRAKWVW